MPKDTFYILTPPEQCGELRVWDALPAHLAYRLSPGMRLLRLQGGQNLRGGIMTVGDCTADPNGPPDAFCLDVERECAARGYRGVILDFDRALPPLSRLVQRLDLVLLRRGITLFVPEYYAPLAPHAKVLISSAISGGSLSQRLQEALERFGPGRTVLAVEKAAEDFILPALDGCGTPLSCAELEQLKSKTCSTVFFSRELCARYFTYRDSNGGIHFVLHDDTDTLCRKLDTARQCGIRFFLLPWAEICAAPDRFGIARTDVPLPTSAPSGTPPKHPIQISPKN